MPKLTDEQAKAIGTRNASVSLSAGAGCGKTFVLTERYLAELDPNDPSARRPADLGELVAITFTDRAAREMRERIALKCYERLQAASGRTADYWLKLLRALDRARVSTIHAFCASLLRAHAVEAGLDPRFAVLEQSQAETLAAELIDDCLRRRLVGRDAVTLELMAELGLGNLRRAMVELLDARETIDRDRWLKATPEEQVDAWEQYFREEVVPLVIRDLADSPDAQTVLRIAEQAKVGHPKMAERVAALMELLPRLESSADPVGDVERVRAVAGVQGCGGRKVWPDEAMYDQFKEAATKLRAEIDKALRYFQFDREAALPAAEAGLKLLGLAASIADAYQEQKRELNVLDFDDLLLRARDLLADPQHAELHRRMASGVRLLLVDEFQDTDPVQVEVVEALCGELIKEGKLFIVGDFKQSIYRFRGADPQVFRRLRGETPEAGRLALTKNFRSQPAILEFVNALFQPQFGSEYEPLQPDRDQVSPRPAVEFIWAQEDGEPLSDETAGSVRRREADWIARRIASLLRSEAPIVWDQEAARAGKPAPRAVKPGDVAILFRALSDVEYYEEALRNYGIDYYLVGGHAFYAQQEIYDLLNVLRALASPCDEISLAGALRSPFFSVSDESLFWLAQHADGLAAGLFADPLPPGLDEDARRRVEFAARTIGELRRRKDRISVAELLHEILARTGYDGVLLAEFLGERKLANLQKLIGTARSFDRSGVFGLSDFIFQLSQFVAAQPREPLAATHPESTDVVRLMTIHQAKGLEFPVVVVPDLERRSGRRYDSPVEFSDRLGPLVRYDKSAPCCGYHLHQAVERREDEAESVRLLYVACTRAADYLILSSGIARLDRPNGLWTKILAERFDLSTGGLIGELPAGYATPEVTVTRTAPSIDEAPGGKRRGPDWTKTLEGARDLARQGKGRDALHSGAIGPDVGARRQFSFSRLTGRMHQREVHPAPDEMEGGEPPAVSTDPLRLGSLTHAVLQEIRFDGANDVAALVGRLSCRTPENKERELAADMVSRFLQSDRARQIAAARQVYPELDFLVAWPEGLALSKRYYFEGTIDCLYQDDAGQWHVLDYKTNVTDIEHLHETAATYEMQLYVYALAAERVLGEPPADLVLHFLRPGLEHHFTWNDQSRRRLEQFAVEAITAIGTPGGEAITAIGTPGTAFPTGL